MNVRLLTSRLGISRLPAMLLCAALLGAALAACEGDAEVKTGKKKYSASGVLDDTFGSSGAVTWNDTNNQAEVGKAIAFQPDRKIVVVGLAFTAAFSDDDIIVRRYNEDGSEDTGFATSGLYTFASNSQDSANAVQIQANGKIVVGGRINGNAFVLRLNADGTVDTGFGASGFVTFASAGNDEVFSLIIDHNQKIVAAGQFNGNNAQLWRLSEVDGSPDTTLGGTGSAAVATPGFATAVLEGPSPYQLYVAGIDFSVNQQIRVWRVDSDGTFDTSGGYGNTAGGTADGANAMAMDSAGRVLVAGMATESGGAPPNEAVVWRFDTSLGQDTTFGGLGYAKVGGMGVDQVAQAIAIDANQRILVAGWYGSAPAKGLLTRLLSDGSTDPSFFLGAGAVFIDTATGAAADNRIFGMRLDYKGRVVLAGQAAMDHTPSADSPDLALWRTL